jgi:hypothetical protein
MFHCLNACCYIIKCYSIVIPRSTQSGVTVWYQSQGFDAEPEWAG